MQTDRPAAPAEFKRFRVATYPDRETVRVAPIGELDQFTAPQLQARLDALHDAESRTVVLDLRGLTFLDSSGVHLAVSWDRRARENGIKYELIQGPRAVRLVFELTGLLDRLPFRPISTENGASSGRANSAPQNGQVIAPAA